MARHSPHLKFSCLVQKQFRSLAEIEKAKIPGVSLALIDGDITLPLLGLAATFDPSQITDVYHFAAVYDLSVEEKLAEKVNVRGTENVLAFCANLPHLKRLHYVSTCYVSGRYDGNFLESDLDCGQSFNNFYESSKFTAEQRVREAMKNGLPATIYRPAIVVGNSETGATQKFDGPYFVMQWMLRQKKTAFLPRFQNPNTYYLNVVPSDYVLDAFFYLSQQMNSVGKTYQLADPKPLSIQEMIQTLGRDCHRRVLLIPFSKNLLKGILKALPRLEAWLGIPRSALDYFDHPTRYDTRQTQAALQNSGITCPSFPDYSKKLVDFHALHPKLRTRPLI